MTTQTLKIKNGVIALPKKLRKSWKETEVYLNASKDTISIKRFSKPSLSLSAMMDEFAQVVKKTKLPKNTIKQVVGNLRRGRK